MPFSRSTLLSWEFISFALVSIGAWLATLNDTITGKQAIWIAAGAAGISALGRGLAKQNADHKNWWQTSEFWMTIVGAAQAVLARLTDVIPGNTMVYLTSALAFALVLSRGIAKAPPDQLPALPDALPDDPPASEGVDNAAVGSAPDPNAPAADAGDAGEPKVSPEPAPPAPTEDTPTADAEGSVENTPVDAPQPDGVDTTAKPKGTGK